MLTACRGAQAHVSPGTMRAVLDVSVSPVVFSHSNASSICDHPRNVPDDVLDRIPANGGIVMATFVAPFSSWERFQWEGENKTGMGVRRLSVTHTPCPPAEEADAPPFDLFAQAKAVLHCGPDLPPALTLLMLGGRGTGRGRD